MKRNKLSPEKMLILTIVSGILITAYMYFFSDTPHFVSACIACPLVTAYMIYALIKEKRDDKKAGELKHGIEDGSYFRSSEQRQKHLEFAQAGGWEEMKAGDMKSDMCRRYHTGTSRSMILMGIFFTACAIALLFSSDPSLVHAAAGAVLGGVCLFFGLSDYTGRPVKRWLKETKSDRSELESSYRSGKLLSNGINSINIGSGFIIVTGKKRVYAFRPEQAGEAGRKVVRVKKYQDDIYAGEEYKYYLTIPVTASDGSSFTVECCLREEQLELALDELNRVTAAGVNARKAEYSEDSKNEIVT